MSFFDYLSGKREQLIQNAKQNAEKRGTSQVHIFLRESGTWKYFGEYSRGIFDTLKKQVQDFNKGIEDRIKSGDKSANSMRQEIKVLTLSFPDYKISGITKIVQDLNRGNNQFSQYAKSRNWESNFKQSISSRDKQMQKEFNQFEGQLSQGGSGIPRMVINTFGSYQSKKPWMEYKPVPYKPVGMIFKPKFVTFGKKQEESNEENNL